MGDRLATIDMGRKLEGLCPFLGRGSWTPMKHNVSWAEDYLHIKWHRDPSSRLATIDMGRKLGALCPLFRGGGAGSPSNTMSLASRPTLGSRSLSNTVWPELRFTCMPIFILMRATVWPQYTNVTERQDRQRSIA